jgi:GNAT superfamily N-acetyltransferase
MIKYGIIQQSDWEQLRPVFDNYGDRLPDQLQATAAIADDGELAGMWMLRTVLHAGPLWVREDLRGKGIWRGLHEQIESLVPHEEGTGYYTFSASDKVEAIHRKLGFKEVHMKLWERRY